MSIRARVSEKAVTNFKAGVFDVYKLSSALANCDAPLNEFYQILNDLSQDCEESISQLCDAQNHVKAKVEEYDKKVNQLSAEIRRIEAEIESIRSIMRLTPKHTIECDDDGKIHMVPNPAYIRLEEKEASVERKLNGVKAQLAEAERKLNNARSVDHRISSHHGVLKNALGCLKEQQSRIRKQQKVLYEVKQNNQKWTQEAIEQLTRIEEICRSYIALKMKIESPSLFNSSDAVAIGLQGFSTNSVASTNNPPSYDGNNQAHTASLKDSSAYRQQTDDNGQVYRINDELVKNSQFQINGYTYKTDGNGRTIQASGKLQLSPKQPRNMEMMNVVGKGSQLETDDRGHLIGHQFMGSDKLENLVPQDQSINKGIYRKLEEHLADLKRDGHDVYISIAPIYRETRRPEAIFYYYSADGFSNAVFFPNYAMEEAK